LFRFVDVVFWGWFYLSMFCMYYFVTLLFFPLSCFLMTTLQRLYPCRYYQGTLWLYVLTLYLSRSMRPRYLCCIESERVVLLFECWLHFDFESLFGSALIGWHRDKLLPLFLINDFQTRSRHHNLMYCRFTWIYTIFPFIGL